MSGTRANRIAARYSIFPEVKSETDNEGFFTHCFVLIDVADVIDDENGG